MAPKMVYISLFLVLFCGSVFSDEVLNLQKCDVEDSDCISEQTKKAFEQLADGVPKLGIKSTNPLVVDAVDGEEFEGVKTHFTNVKFTGLKTLKDAKFKLDRATKFCELNLTFDAKVVADITFELADSKTLSGTYTSEAPVIAKSTYNYDTVKDNKGEEHFVIGPETINCEVLTDPKVTLNPELDAALNKDPETKSKREKFDAEKVEIRKKIFCNILKKATEVVYQNFRQLDKEYPVTTYFKNF